MMPSVPVSLIEHQTQFLANAIGNKVQEMTTKITAGTSVSQTNNELGASRSSEPNQPETETTQSLATVVVSQLSDLATIDRKEIVPVYMSSLDTIYRYCMQDIKGTLGSFEMDILSYIHCSLFEKSQRMFPQYKDKRPINRQVKHTIIPDIAQMGYCLVNKLATKEMDKLLVTNERPEPEHREDVDATAIGQTELAELIQVVTRLRIQVTQLENDLRVTQKTNGELQDKLILMEDTNQNRFSKVEEEISVLRASSQSISDFLVPGHSVQDTYSDSSSSISDVESCNETFQMQSKQLRKLRKKQRKRAKKEAAAIANQPMHDQLT
jgi:hypothetical protein